MSNSTETKNTSNLPAPRLSIVIPAFREEKRLPKSISDLRTFFAQVQDLEILIIVEKSPDKTLEVTQDAAHGDARFKVIDNKIQRGKGYAVRTGMLLAQGEIVIYMDADLSTPLSEVFNFLQCFSENPEAQVVIGSRAEAKSQILRSQSWLRRNMGRTFNRLVQAFGIKGIEDTQCGFKAFRRAASQAIFKRQTLDGFAFDVEVLMLAEELGLKTIVRPVRWVNDPDSKVRILIDPLKMLLDLIKVRGIVKQTLRDQP